MQILEGSPWLQSQPVYVLAVQQPDSEHGLTYILRVRVSKPEAENELSRVSKSTQKHPPLCMNRAMLYGLPKCCPRSHADKTFCKNACSSRCLHEAGCWKALLVGAEFLDGIVTHILQR